MYLMNCKFCNRCCASKNGLRSHQNTCSANPERVPGKNGQGWVDPKIRSENARKSNLLRDVTVNEKIKETCLKKAASGQWHHGAGRSKKHVYKGVKLDSSWELKLAQFWDSIGVVWERNRKTFPYEWRGTVRSYLPDFYLPEQDLYIEVKGYKTDRDDAKWSAFPLRLEVYDAARFKKENIAL